MDIIQKFSKKKLETLHSENNKDLQTLQKTGSTLSTNPTLANTIDFVNFFSQTIIQILHTAHPTQTIAQKMDATGKPVLNAQNNPVFETLENRSQICINAVGRFESEQNKKIKAGSTPTSEDAALLAQAELIVGLGDISDDLVKATQNPLDPNWIDKLELIQSLQIEKLKSCNDSFQKLCKTQPNNQALQDLAGVYADYNATVNPAQDSLATTKSSDSQKRSLMNQFKGKFQALSSRIREASPTSQSSTADKSPASTKKDPKKSKR